MTDDKFAKAQALRLRIAQLDNALAAWKSQARPPILADVIDEGMLGRPCLTTAAAWDAFVSASTAAIRAERTAAALAFSKL